MKNIKLTIQYDGTRYQGWQKPGKKGNSNTISGKLTEVISRITDEETTLFAGAKTDTNVHADAQIVNFKTNTTLSALKLKQELNHYLPQDIAIISAEEVSERFHASLNAQTITCDTSKVITNKPKKMRPGSYCPAQNVQHKILRFHRRMRFFPSPCQACFSAPGLKSAARLH